MPGRNVARGRGLSERGRIAKMLDDMMAQERSPAVHPAIALALHATLVALIVRWVSIYAWDDGAITLAYSKAFASSGRIALTALSEQVEGFSSVSWFLLNAAFARLDLTFEHAILAAQIAAGVFLGGTILLTWRLGRSLGLRSDTTFAVLVVLALFGPAITEVANGMEMTLLTACGLAMIHALYMRRNLAVFAVVAVVFLGARFEAMIYYAAILAPLLLQRRFRTFFALALFGLGVIGLQEVARMMLFGDIVPNTIRAKMHAPYSSAGLGALQAHFHGTIEALAALFPLLFAGAAALNWSARARREWLEAVRAPRAIAPGVLALLSTTAAVIAFVTLVGKNWGYTGRMEFLALPCGLLLAGMIFDRYLPAMRVRWRRALLLAITGAIILASWMQSAGPIIAVGVANARGEPVGQRLGVNPASYRQTALAVQDVRRRAGLKRIVFLTPDVGGVGLCCSDIRVVDIALLTNQQLARKGYQAFRQVFARERPEVIGVQLMWAEFSGIYDLPAFREDYEPAIVHDTRFYIRRDVVAAMARSGPLTYCQVRDDACLRRPLAEHRYVEHASKFDDVAFLRQGRVLIMDQGT